MGLPDRRAMLELVRLPAALSVPGDVLLGAAASGALRGRRGWGRSAGLVAASTCLYLAGMALNDYADREVDARERPGRPIPSGRVTPELALGLAGVLSAAGVAAAGLAAGRRGLTVALPLAGAVWAYDLVLKGTLLGPAAMSACRALDVLMGSGPGGARRALPAAGVVGAHTLTITTVSRREVQGARGPVLPLAALAGTTGVVVVAARLSQRFGWRRAAAAGLLAAYAAPMLRAELRAARDPTPANLQRVVGTGVLGLLPLHAALLSRAAPAPAVAAVVAAWPLARYLARRVSPT